MDINTRMDIDLAAYCDRTKSKGCWRESYLLDFAMTQRCNCETFYLTLSCPNFEGSLAEEWSHLTSELTKAKTKLFSNCDISCGVISLEAYKTTSLKSKEGKNTKTGRPFASMLVWAYPFGDRTESFLSYELSDLDLSFTIKQLNCRTNAAKALTFMVKDCSDANLQRYVAKTTAWKKSVNLWYGDKNSWTPLGRLEREIGSDNLYISDESGFSDCNSHAE